MSSRIAFLLVVSVAGLSACAFPINRRNTLADEMGYDQPLVEAPVVQIREFPHSPTVSIVAWAPDEPGYGLSAQLRRDGSIVLGHQLYVSTYYSGGFSLTNVARMRHQWRVAQTVVPAKQLLLSTGVSRDPYHCHWGGECSPYEIRGLLVSDDLLRANRDSVAVRVYSRGWEEMVITVHRPLIDAYLAAVDSVSAALRTTW